MFFFSLDINLTRIFRKWVFAALRLGKVSGRLKNTFTFSSKTATISDALLR